jgi:hypothetical protein
MDWILVTTGRPTYKFDLRNDEIRIADKPNFLVTTKETEVDYQCPIKCFKRQETFWATRPIRLQEVNEVLLNLL